jgi:hypothetical protein
MSQWHHPTYRLCICVLGWRQPHSQLLCCTAHARQCPTVDKAACCSLLLAAQTEGLQEDSTGTAAGGTTDLAIATQGHVHIPYGTAYASWVTGSRPSHLGDLGERALQHMYVSTLAFGMWSIQFKIPQCAEHGCCHSCITPQHVAVCPGPT